MSLLNSNLLNVVLLGIAFLFLFGAFQTSSMIEQTVLDAASHEPNSTFHGSGYISLAIIYTTFALANWVAPFIVVLFGCKYSMFFSAAVYTLFIASFLEPIEWVLYLGSALLGIAAAFLWTAQGNYITCCSEKETVGRNSGLFWAIFQGSLLFGNLYQYLAFKDQEGITKSARVQFYIVMTVCASLGSVLLLFLKKERRHSTPPLINSEMYSEINDSSSSSNVESGSNVSSAVEAFMHSFQLIREKKMLLLMLTFLYSGLELTFYSGVYGTSVGHTLQFGTSAKAYIGLIGIMIGLGEILGGVLFSYLSKDGRALGRSGVIILGFIVHMLAFLLIFINLPDDSPLVDTTKLSYIQPSLAIVLICGFLLGFGDSAFNTQIMAVLGYLFAGVSSPSAFAIFKFTQSLAAACAFYYSSYMLLHYQLLVLIITGFVGTLSFVFVDAPTALSTSLEL